MKILNIQECNIKKHKIIFHNYKMIQKKFINKKKNLNQKVYYIKKIINLKQIHVWN